jgi:DNA primase
MALTKTFTEEVKSQADIVRIVSDYIALKKRGKNYLANCPFHTEKTPSFNVNPAMQIFHCFGCNAGGDVFSFVMQMEHCDFVQAVKLIAEKIGIPVPKFEQRSENSRFNQEREELLQLNAWAVEFFQEQFDSGPDGGRALEYLEKRSITEKTRKDLRLGYAPDRWDALSGYLRARGANVSQIERSGLVTVKENGSGHYDRFRGRIIFPITDAQGQVIAFGGRTMGDAEPKYLNSPETVLYSKGRHLFGLFNAKEAIRKQQFAILVEGYLDFVIPYQEGVHNIVASLGTALTEHHVRLLGRYMSQPRVVVNFDPDSAGIAATKRSLELLLEQGYKVNVLSLPDGEDPDTFVKNHGIAMYRQMLKKSQPYLEYILTQSMREHDITRPAGKVETLNAILPYLRKMRDRIERADYAEQIADRLKIDARVVREELKRAAVGRREQLDSKKIAASSRVLPAERRLLELLLASERLRSKIADSIIPELTVGLVTAPIFTALLTLIEEGREINFSNLQNAIMGDEESGGHNEALKQCEGILSGLIIGAADLDELEEAQLLDEAEQAFAALRRMRIEQQMTTIQFEINSAQREGDSARATDLSLKKFELARRLKEHFSS